LHLQRLARPDGTGLEEHLAGLQVEHGPPVGFHLDHLEDRACQDVEVADLGDPDGGRAVLADLDLVALGQGGPGVHLAGRALRPLDLDLARGIGEAELVGREEAGAPGSRLQG
jgi:hypothetical protein